MITVERYHDISCGHRVVGHENKCRLLHGHNYRVHFAVAAPNDRLDDLGRVMDFSWIKDTLCDWLEQNWDHRFLIWKEDPWLPALRELTDESLCVVPFNPTAENMAFYLLHTIAPDLLAPHGCHLVWCRIEETRKCSVTVTNDKYEEK